MIVFLTEEESMKGCLEVILPQLWPGSWEGVNWLVLSFQGKSDLEKSIPQKMRAWNYGNPHFIILRDGDGGDCVEIKRKLHDLAFSHGKPFHVRIVCQELESWLLGDLDAVKCAYPQAKIPSRMKKKFREPDILEKPSEKLKKIN